MKRIFIDTGVYTALADQDDQFHSQAQRLLKKLNEMRLPQVTIHPVLVEAYNHIRRRIGHNAAIRTGENINRLVANRQLEIVYVDKTLDEAAWQIFRQYAEQSFSYVDCISFAWLKQNPRTEVFTFDEHFRWMGFKAFA